MPIASTGYNLNHLQIAPKGATPTFKDVNYATTAEFTVDQDSDTLQADGGTKATAYSARQGSGSIGFASAALDTIAAMTGDEYSSSGTAGAAIDRLEVGGSTVPPSLVLAAWIPNVDGNSTAAGMRVTVPNGSLAVPSTTFEQESWTEFEADLSFVTDENDLLLIWETLATAPTFTAGVMPVNLVAPA